MVVLVGSGLALGTVLGHRVALHAIKGVRADRVRPALDTDGLVDPPRGHVWIRRSGRAVRVWERLLETVVAGLSTRGRARRVLTGHARKRARGQHSGDG